MRGWIKLHREILDHWIWQDEKYFRWWVIILMHVNHESVKFPVGSEIMICGPGESFRSIEEWSSLFMCSKKTVFKFFGLLKNDGMIDTKILGSGNRRKHLLTVINWGKYQNQETENYTERKPKTTPKRDHNKNEKNEKNENLLFPPLIPQGENAESWKTNFEIYVFELGKAYDEISRDITWISKQERLNPNIDVLTSIEKAVENFWKTEDGWRNKKKQKTDRINWRLTFANSISNNLNKVRKERGRSKMDSVKEMARDLGFRLDNEKSYDLF